MKRRLREAEADRRMQELIARMAAVGVVVEPMAPNDPLARIDFEPVGRRGQDDKDLGRPFKELNLEKIEKPRYLDEVPSRRFTGDR